MAEKRVSKTKLGNKLTIFDFKYNFFENNCPGFSNAIFLMETFYEDPSMFFENLGVFADSYSKNGSFENKEDFADSHPKNGSCENKGNFADSHHKNGSFEVTRDFVDSLNKNDILEKIGDLAESHPKNGCFLISGFFAFFTRKKANFRIFTKRRFCNIQPPYFYNIARFDKTLSRVGLAGIKLCYGRGHRFSITLEKKISRYK